MISSEDVAVIRIIVVGREDIVMRTYKQFTVGSIIFMIRENYELQGGYVEINGFRIFDLGRSLKNFMFHYEILFVDGLPVNSKIVF